MKGYLTHLSCTQGVAFAAVRSDSARAHSVLMLTCSSAAIPSLRQQSPVIADRIALDQQHNASTAGFPVALWSVLGYGPAFSPGEDRGA
jgi:hypothetical protein